MKHLPIILSILLLSSPLYGYCVNKSFNSQIKLSFIIFVFIFLIKAPIQAQSQPSGVVKLVEGYGIIIRNGTEINIQKKGTIIKNGDLIRTNVPGKIILTLLGGDDFFIAPNTEIKFKENKKKKGLSNIINRNLNLKGRLLAKIKKGFFKTHSNKNTQCNCCC